MQKCVQLKNNFHFCGTFKRIIHIMKSFSIDSDFENVQNEEHVGLFVNQLVEIICFIT